MRPWKSLLLGNGASSALWSKFGYDSLFDTARYRNTTHPLDPADVAVFESLGTTNFERVLSKLQVAQQTAAALGSPLPLAAQRYLSIQQALIEAVGSVHPAWQEVPDEILQLMGNYLSAYRSVYTTNYDLIVYWSRMTVDLGDLFKDYFWSNNEFDPVDTELSAGAIRVLHLHGALHLYRHEGRTRKRTRQAGENLLEQFTKTFAEGDVPLFVSEGSSEDKMKAINDSSYLSFAYGQFADDHEPLVVFGHSLKDDKHVTTAMLKHAPWEANRPIAISVNPDGQDVVQQKLAYHQVLPHNRASLVFFDSRTHPLGDPALQLVV